MIFFYLFFSHSFVYLSMSLSLNEPYFGSFNIKRCVQFCLSLLLWPVLADINKTCLLQLVDIKKEANC